MKNVHVIQHPMVQHKLTHLRMKDTSTGKFRTLLRELALLIGYEVTRSLDLSTITIQTPLGESFQSKVLAEHQIALIAIMRAGIGLLDGMLQLLPNAKVGHIGLYRDVSTSAVIEYYFKVPNDLSRRKLLVLDPMLATGQSAVAAVDRLKELKPKGIELVCVLSSPEGLTYLQESHPDLKVYTAAIDRGLNDDKYIVPGIGDAGDRLFGTL